MPGNGGTNPNGTTTETNTNQTECGENKFYNDCGSACPANCSHFNPPPVCNRACARGCYCKDGFLEDESRNCIPQKMCEGCTGNTTFSSCKTRCPVTCNGQDRNSCALACYMGCICKPNYVRVYWEKTNEGPCVLPTDCPKTKTKN